MKRKEKAAVDEFVALVGGKTWEPVRHKCMGKWSSGMTDYGFVIDGRITLFVSNSMAYFKRFFRPLCVSRNKRQAVQASNSGIKLRYYGG